MKPQIIDRFVYVKGKKISEVENTGTLHGKELIPIADNNQNFHTTVDQISDYVDNSHDYLTTEDYNDLKSQIDSERTNRQEADNELNQSIQDTKSELHSTISNVESELLNEVSDLQGQIDNINDTGIANGVTLDTVQTITGEKTFTTVPKSTASATSANDLTNKNYVDTAISEALGDTISNVVTTNTAQEISGLKTFKTLPKGDGTPTVSNDLVTKQYVDNAVANADVDLDGYATQTWVNEQGFAKTSDIPEGLEIGETTGTAFDGARGKAVEQYVHKVPVHIVGRNSDNFSTFLCNDSTNTDENIRIKYKQLNRISGASEDNFIIIPSATSEKAGVMSAADKQKLDSLSDSSDIYVIDYITGTSGTVTQEQYNELRSAIESKKVIIFTVDTLQYVVTCSFLEDSLLKLYFSLNDITQGSNALQVNALILHINSNGEYYTKSPHINLYSNGDGTKFLGDDGHYHIVDTSEIVADIEGKYDKTGGTVTGDVTIQTANARINISDTTIPSGTVTMYVTENGATLSNTLGNSAGSELILNDNNVRFHKKSGDDYYNILHEGNYESVIGDVLLTSEADNKYLPLTGGLLKGNLQRTIYVDNAASNLYATFGKYPDDDLTENRTSFVGQYTEPYGNVGEILGLAFDQIAGKIYSVNEVRSSGNKLSELLDSSNYQTIIGNTYAKTNISGGLNITSITQSAYDELQDKDANTLYIITE